MESQIPDQVSQFTYYCSSNASDDDADNDADNSSNTNYKLLPHNAKYSCSICFDLLSMTASAMKAPPMTAPPMTALPMTASPMTAPLQHHYSTHDSPIHEHPLTFSNATNIYDNVPGSWICDSCRRSGSIIGTDFSWHCSVCEFDCCEQCLLPVRIRNHEHALEITDSKNVYLECNGGWKCDLCQTEFEPGKNHQNKPYHCFSCQFDACRLCIQQILLEMESQIPDQVPQFTYYCSSNASDDNSFPNTNSELLTAPPMTASPMTTSSMNYACSNQLKTLPDTEFVLSHTIGFPSHYHNISVEGNQLILR